MYRFLAILLIILSSTCFASFAIEVEVRYSDKFQKQLESDLGIREGEILSKSIIANIDKVFSKTSINPLRVVVTIEGAKPNKPTMQQLIGNAGLSHSSSFGVGGMALRATVIDPNGEHSTQIRKSWYSNDIYSAKYTGTWSDANRASRRFARHLKKLLQKESR